MLVKFKEKSKRVPNSFKKIEKTEHVLDQSSNLVQRSTSHCLEDSQNVAIYPAARRSTLGMFLSS